LYSLANRYLIVTFDISQEIFMFKKVVIGATALTLLASAVVYAQQRPAQPDFGRGTQARMEDRAAFLDARIAALHAGLRLSPDQEKSWPGFEQAYRDLAVLRPQRAEGQGDRQRLGQNGPGDRQRTAQMVDPIQRAQRGADALAARSTALKHYADAAAPLYQTFDNGQKRRFAILSRMHRPQNRQFASLRGEHNDRGDRGNYSTVR
jgi:hypothetical protein